MQIPWWVSQKGKGDVYVTRVSSSKAKIGQPHLKRQSKNDLVVKVDRDVLLPSYMYYVLMFLAPELANRARGSVQQYITVDDVHDVLRKHFTRKNPAPRSLEECERQLAEAKYVSKWRKEDLAATSEELEETIDNLAREKARYWEEEGRRQSFRQREMRGGSPNPEIVEIVPSLIRRANAGSAEEERYFLEEEMRMVIGPRSFGRRRQPRVRLRKGRPGYYTVLGRRRTKKAAFRAARHLRDGTTPMREGGAPGQRGDKRPLVVFPLPKEARRKTHDWAFATRVRSGKVLQGRFKEKRRKAEKLLLEEDWARTEERASFLEWKSKQPLVQNPEILSILNPASVGDMERAKAKYREFHGVDPERITIRGRGGKRKRQVLIVLGRLVDLIYEPRRGERKRIHWIHAFGKDARLATDPTGKQLFIFAKEGVRQVDFSRGIIS